MRYFSPDIRNVGGKKIIASIISHHYTRMIEMKPTFTNRCFTPVKHSFSPANFLSTGKKNQGKLHVFSGNNTDSWDSPKCKTDKKPTGADEEHKKNIENMQRRIFEYSSVSYKQPQERKKHLWDPIHKPVILFRTKNEAQNLTLNTSFIRRTLKPGKPTYIYNIVNKEQSTPNRIQIKQITRQLIQAITAQRIYKDEDLEKLFSDTRKANSSINSTVLNEAFKIVRNTLDS